MSHALSISAYSGLNIGVLKVSGKGSPMECLEISSLNSFTAKRSWECSSSTRPCSDSSSGLLSLATSKVLVCYLGMGLLSLDHLWYVIGAVSGKPSLRESLRLLVLLGLYPYQ